LRRLASEALRYLQLYEARGRPPTPNEFGAQRFPWEALGGIEAGWARYEWAIETARTAPPPPPGVPEVPPRPVPPTPTFSPPVTQTSHERPADAPSSTTSGGGSQHAAESDHSSTRAVLGTAWSPASCAVRTPRSRRCLTYLGIPESRRVFPPQPGVNRYVCPGIEDARLQPHRSNVPWFQR
jgi:hypothetical protein